jgi:UDP-GlcNAc:undecaprenyl-phosphate GlcNAc-1-phosphate transferase
MMTRAWGIAIALFLMTAWGLYLDRRLPRRHRRWLLLGQVLAGLVLFLYGFRIRELSLGGWVFDTGVFSLPLTLLWIVLMVNFLRFFDGIDGLMAAVGLAIVAAHLFGVGEREYFVHLLCAVFGGTLAGLFLVTVYPARVYLGYNGSSLPGLCLAALTLASRSKTFTAATVFLPVAVVVVVAAFALVLFVESRVLVRRERGGGAEGPSS